MTRLRRWLCGLLTDHEAAYPITDGRLIAHYHCASCGHEWTRKL